MNRIPEAVVLDTCVLLSSALRRLLFELADRGGFKPIWSETIGHEWRRNAGRLWQVAQTDVDEQWGQLQHDYPAANVGDVESFKQGLVYSDPKDWHVVAAGRAAQARDPGTEVGIITRNKRDFNRSELRRLGLRLMDPDQFLVFSWEDQLETSQAALEAFYDGLALEAMPIDLSALLKRERLFRFNRLCAAYVENMSSSK